jgi:nucleoside-diphosphate-sugar epimerase
MLRLGEQRKTGVYNLGAPRFGTLRDDLEALIRHAGTRARVVGLPPGPTIAALRLADWLRISPLAPWHYLTYHKSFHFDVTRAMRDVGWQPRYGNQDMLNESYDWFLAERESAAREASRSVHRKPVRQGIIWVLKRLS